MVSCNKENKGDNTKLPTKADLVGTWEGSYSGTATLEEKQSVSYTIVWTLTMNPKNAATFGSLSYKLNITGYEELVRTVGITGYGVRQNTDHGSFSLHELFPSFSAVIICVNYSERGRRLSIGYGENIVRMKKEPRTKCPGS